MKLPGGVYGITSADFGGSHVEAARMLLEGGVKIIQYREKHASTRRMFEEAREIRRLCLDWGAVFIVNDRVDVALAVGADGVHLGQDDLPLTAARRLLPEGIIGVSARSVDEALAAEANGATYLGVGSVYPTHTKADTELIGEEGLKSILGRVRIPVYAIGGIRLEHLKRLKAYGVRGVAVISAILGDADPRGAARRFVSEWMNG